ncbi:OmpP1/FadL family transporter [Solemya elarraichensis gill symbiont]|uniref:Long-chain fatty acid transporter n=1 Tax=Solemya elarraichensis gill symbiont TaxID=1918949 RepID=A0A1T2L6K9_9GAMM|nr:outer membrane protein transport protein [Solemya elarraichensis gill symbiont]OOZ40721.1 hypothetical protein BOW52_05495 [Solemya elarraichensis gill symbiont]
MKKSLTALAISAALVAPAFATNGMAPVGIGQMAKGMGGASIAYPQDSLQGSNNPAGMVHLGNRMDVGIEIFIPNRGFSTTEAGFYDPGVEPGCEVSCGEATAPALVGDYNGNGSGAMESWFPIPEFGYNRMINDDLSVGVSVFGNGGMNTTYRTDHPFSILQSPSFNEMEAPPWDDGPNVGIDLMQLFVTPSISYKVNDKLSVGAALNLIAARFSADGIAMFGGFSADPSNLSDNGNSYAYGASLRVGMQAQLSDAVTVGATYQTIGKMSEFDEYSGLFPDGGTMDIHANWGVGIAIKATDKLDIAMDVMQILYGGTNAMGNNPNSVDVAAGGSPAACDDPADTCFGDNDGPGFGWGDQTVYKLGLAYQYSDDLTLRAGYNYGETPVDLTDLGFALNTLAPGITEHHATFGFTKSLGDGASITGSYIHTFNKKQDGTLSLPSPDGSYVMNDGYLEMSQNAFGIAYNKTF